MTPDHRRMESLQAAGVFCAARPGSMPRLGVMVCFVSHKDGGVRRIDAQLFDDAM